MAAGVRSIRVKFDGDASGLQRASRQAGAAAEGATKKTSAMGAKLQAFAGGVVGGLAAGAMGAISSFAGGAVDAFSAVEDATAAAEVQFGDAAKGIVKWSEAASKGFGMSKQEALDANNTFGTFGKAAGLAEADLLRFTTGLTGLAGDLASFKGTSTEQAINAIGGALRGETEGMRAYGVLLSADAIAAEALSSGIAKTTKDLGAIKAANFAAQEAQTKYNAAVKEHGEKSVEAEKASIGLAAAEKRLAKETAGAAPKLTDQQKLMATQSLIFKSTADAQGDYSRTSSSTANVQKTLAAETLNAQAALGAKLAPAVTAVRNLKLKLIQTLTGLIQKIDTVVGFVRRNSEVFTALAAVIGALVLPALIKTGVQATIAGAKSVAAAAATAAGWVAAGIASTAAAVATAAAWVAANLPLVLLIATVALVVATVVKYWDEIKAVVDKVWGGIKRSASAVIGWFRANWPVILAVLTGPFGLAVLAIVKYRDEIWHAIQKVPGWIAGAFNTVADVLTAPFRLAFNAIADLWNNTIGRLSFSVPDWVPFMGGKGWDVPDIPRFAAGGPMAAGQLGLVGERGPELFIPRSAGSVVPNGGDVAVEIHATGPTLADIVRVEIKQANRATRAAVLAGSRRAHA